MAVPKRRTSRSRTRTRRSQWKADRPALTTVHLNGRPYRVPRALTRAYERGLLPPPS
ncbi:50S ribosomal protein L32 [Nocardiopsis coralliicola]